MSASTSTPQGFSLYRPLRLGGGNEEDPSPPRNQEKRRITAVACLACQKKRCKCDGKRPRCTACASVNSTTDCVFETRGNQSRSEALKERNRELKDENTRLREMLYSTGGTMSHPKNHGQVMTPTSATAVEASPSPGLSRESIQSSICGTSQPIYNTATDFFEESSGGTITPNSVLNGSDALQEMQIPLAPDAPPVDFFEPSPELVREHEPQTEPNEIIEEEHTLQLKVARLEVEVETLKAAVWQHFSLQNQGASGLGMTASQAFNQSKSLGTIDPSHITIEHRDASMVTSAMSDYWGQNLPFTDLLTAAAGPVAAAGAVATAASVPGVDPFNSSDFNSDETDWQLPFPPSRSKRQRTSSDNVKIYIHKRRRYGPIVRLFGNLPLSSAILANHQPRQIQETQVRSLDLPAYLLQILNSEDHGLQQNANILSPEFASTTIYNFRAHGRRLVANHGDVNHVLGPNEIDVQQLFRNEPFELSNHTTATFAPWFLQAYPSMSLPNKVACALLIQLILRWQISPTKEHFDAIPEWLKPSGAQLFIPHISAFDLIPWPEIRDLLIAEGKFPERQVLVMIISNFTISWPWNTEDIFTWDFKSGLAIGVSPFFMEYVQDIGNWAINDKVLKEYPYLEGKARFVNLERELEQFPSDKQREAHARE